MALHEVTTNKRALVTGCAGFLGSHLSETLIDQGWTVTGIDCFTDYYSPVIKRGNLLRLMDEPRFTLHEVDLSIDPLDDVVDGVDKVFHLAAQAGVRGSFGTGFETYVRNNITASQRLLEAAVRRDVSTFVYASSSSVYGDAAVAPTDEGVARHPVSPYGMTKVATEELAGVYSRTHGMPTVGLRYFTAYGPRQRPDMAFSKFITAGLLGEPITVNGDGRQMRDFTFVSDVVEATISAAHLEGSDASVFNVGGGSSVALVDVIDYIGQVLGRPLIVEHVQRQIGDARNTAADLTRAAADLGYRPKVDLEAGITAHIEWLAERAEPMELRPVVAAG
jgi:UDP-glucose 4-epimerase